MLRAPDIDAGSASVGDWTAGAWRNDAILLAYLPTGTRERPLRGARPRHPPSRTKCLFWPDIRRLGWGARILHLPHGSQKPKQKQSLASIVAQANVASLWSSFQARIYDLAVAN
jgi:hypothetical protein